MAKRSLRRAERHEKDQAGCIGGLISIFDFRRGRTTTKLITDRRRRSKHADDVGSSKTKLSLLRNLGENCRSLENAATEDIAMTIMKNLVEEDMINDENRHLGTANCHEISEHKVTKTPDLGVILYELYHQILERDISCVKQHDDIDIGKKTSVSEEKLNAAIQVCIKHWLLNAKDLKEDENSPYNSEFLDALQALTNNKEALLEFLKDSNTSLMRLIQDMEKVQLKQGPNSNILSGNNFFKEDLNNSKPAEHIIHTGRNFFRRSKSQESFPSMRNETCQASSRIVILKPGHVRLKSADTELCVGKSLWSDCVIENKTSEKNSSHFSFTKIKRKLKNVMTKERHGFSHQKLDENENSVGADGTSLCSPNRDHFYFDKFAKTSIMKREKIDAMKDFGTDVTHESPEYLQQGTSRIYNEAKKHLSKMLTNGDKDAELIVGQLPESLGRILSLPEYNCSPSCSPQQDGGHMRLSQESNPNMYNEKSGDLIQDDQTTHLSPLADSYERASLITNCYLDERVDSLNSNQHDVHKVNPDGSVNEFVVPKGAEMEPNENLDTVMCTTPGNDCGEVLDVSCQSTGSLVANDVNCCSSTVYVDPNGEKPSPSLELDLFESDQSLSSPVSSPSSSLLTQKVGNPESATDQTDRPSPISVLEPLLSEDDVSPASILRQSDEATIQPVRIVFEDPDSFDCDQRICLGNCMEDEESAFDYVEAVLLGSGLVWDEFLERWISSCEVLDPSLFDEVELFSNRSPNDQKLLFDCTNEVLTDICEYYFNFFPRNIRPIPKATDLIHEVWKGVEHYLIQDPSPRSLDQLVKKDMEKLKKWISKQPDIEDIGTEIEKIILEELMEDIMLSFTSDGLEGSFSILPDESNKTDSCVSS